MRIRTKLAVLLALTGLLLLVGLLLFRHAQHATLRLIAENEQRTRLKTAEQLILLQSEPLRGMVQDYTFWDDMVAFIRSPNRQWAQENIDSALRTFDIDHAWVCRPDGTIIYSTGRDPGPHPELPLSAGALGKAFAGTHLPRFFVATDAGPLEVFGASIHPTRDEQRLTPAAGYFFVARHWDADFLGRISELLHARATILAAIGDKPPQSHVDGDGLIELTLPLLAIDGQEAAWLDLHARSPYIQQLHDTSRTLLSWAAFGALLFMALLTVAVERWVNRPLASLCRSLETDSAPPDTLRSAPHEFGQLARLIGEFFEQKARLQREAEEHLRARKALEESQATLAQVFDNAPIGLLALDERLRITHLNTALQKMSGYLRRELHEEHFSLLLHPEDYDRFLQVYREMRQGVRHYHRAEVRYLNKAGEVIRGRQTDVAIRGPKGELLSLVSMIEDFSQAGERTEPATTREDLPGESSSAGGISPTAD